MTTRFGANSAAIVVLGSIIGFVLAVANVPFRYILAACAVAAVIWERHRGN